MLGTIIQLICNNLIILLIFKSPNLIFIVHIVVLNFIYVAILHKV